MCWGKYEIDDKEVKPSQLNHMTVGFCPGNEDCDMPTGGGYVCRERRGSVQRAATSPRRLPFNWFLMRSSGWKKHPSKSGSMKFPPLAQTCLSFGWGTWPGATFINRRRARRLHKRLREPWCTAQGMQMILGLSWSCWAHKQDEHQCVPHWGTKWSENEWNSQALCYSHLLDDTRATRNRPLPTSHTCTLVLNVLSWLTSVVVVAPRFVVVTVCPICCTPVNLCASFERVWVLDLVGGRNHRNSTFLHFWHNLSVGSL